MKLFRPGLIMAALPEKFMSRCVIIITAVMLITATVGAARAQEPRHIEIRIINPSPPEQPQDKAPVVTPSGQPGFTQEELDQILAPIALYPDDLLAQILMAATYPLEVVEAARWVQTKENLTGEQLAIALEQTDWDPSVKSLVNFPAVLQVMNDNMEWMQRLGDTFLGQPDQVMDTVQGLRQRARSQGNLATTDQESVSVEPQSQDIIIEPATPDVVYVPVYDPVVVYGVWSWPAHPPYRISPRAVVNKSFFAAPRGVAWGYAWGGFNWPRHEVVVNMTRNSTINPHINRSRYAGYSPVGAGSPTVWKHDPVHRVGVAYRAPSVAQQFGSGSRPGADVRRDYRGFDRGGGGQVAVQQSNRSTMQQPRVASSPPVSRPEPPRQPPAPARQAVQGVQGSTAFDGAGPASQTRQLSDRGHESLSSARTASSAPGAVRSAPSSGGQGGGASGGGGQRR